MTTVTHQGDAHIITASAGQLPTRIEIFPTGTITLRDARGTVGVVADAEALIERTMAQAKGGMLPIDFGHGMDGEAGADPRAAGWITSLSVEGDRIMADVEWTSVGAEALEGRLFRFISPTFTANERTRQIGRILRAGLTNDPALPELRQLASKQENDEMPQWMKDLAAKLGLPEDADEATIQATAEKAIDQVAHIQPVITAAGLTGDLTEAGATGIVTKLTASNAGAPDPAAFVPRVAFDEMKVQLAALQTQVSTDRASDVVTAAMADGKLPPRMEQWGRDYAAKDLAGFQTWLASTPVIVDGQVQTPAGDPNDADDAVLTASEKAVCAEMGLTEEAFLATKQGDAAPAVKKGA